MAKRKGKHVSDTQQYGAYASLLKRQKNRKARLARHLKAHPEDAQAVTAYAHDGKQKSNPNSKGNYPAKKHYIYDGAGRKFEVQAAEPKFNKGTK